MPPQEQPGHTIRIVTRRTGLSAHVIRVWERRYGAVTPTRTETNRRLYTDADIERLRLLQQATNAGHSIGQIASLPQERLAELVRQDAVPEAVAAAPRMTAQPQPPEQTVGACMAAVRQLDAAGLEMELARAAVDMSRFALMEQVIDPLMQGIGEAWQNGSLRVADEHMASAVVRAFLGGLQDLRQPSQGPGIVVTTPAGQVHEVGAMMAAATASAAGWRAVYLGPDLPADEISSAARRHEARAVALSVVYPIEDPHLPGELRRLRQGLDDTVEIFAGGRAAGHHAGALHEIGACVISDLADLRQQLTDRASEPMPQNV